MSVLILQISYSLRIKSKTPSLRYTKFANNRQLQSTINLTLNFEASSILPETSEEGEEYQDEYFSNIYGIQSYIGTPNISTSLLLDTGSSWTWVPLYNLNYTDDSEYRCINSTTCSNTTAYINYSNYQGLIQGWVVTDVMTIDSATFDNFTFLYADNYEYESIYDLPYYPVYDGVLGLGLNSNSSYLSLLDFLYQNGNISEYYFSLYVEGNPYSNIQSSFVDFGNYDEEFIYQNSSFQYIPLVEGAEDWSIEFTNYSLGNIGTYQPTYGQAVVASGSQYIGVPSSDFDNIYDQFGNNQINCNYFNSKFLCQCKYGNISGFPNISLTTSTGFQLSIPSWAYIIYIPYESYKNLFLSIDFAQNNEEGQEEEGEEEEGEGESNEYEEIEDFYDQYGPYGGYMGPYYPYPSIGSLTPGDFCQVLIQPSNVSSNNSNMTNRWILGTPFLQNYYTLFFKQNSSLGFAQANQTLLKFFKPIAENSIKETKSAIWAIILSISGSLLIIILIVVVVKHYSKANAIERRDRISSSTLNGNIGIEDSRKKKGQDNQVNTEMYSQKFQVYENQTLPNNNNYGTYNNPSL